MEVAGNYVFLNAALHLMHHSGCIRNVVVHGYSSVNVELVAEVLERRL